MMQDILLFAHEHVAMGEAVALISITKTYGSSPASLGQFMVVLADGTTKGTVGGGKTEYEVIQKAIQAITNKEKIFTFDFNHAASGMVCGGGMAGFGHILGNENHLYIFGGGHVAQHLAPLALATGFFVTIIEDRPELAKSFNDVRYVTATSMEYREKVAIDAGDYVVICTRGHATDADALRFCLSQAHPSRYLGMIGSTQKVATLLTKLQKEGYTEAQLSQLYSPIGLDIASAIPAEIAVAILAEILLVKNNGSLQHKRSLRQAFSESADPS